MMTLLAFPLPFWGFLSSAIFLFLVVLLIYPFARRQRHTLVALVWLVLGTLAFWCIRSYTFPHPSKHVFYNTSYHVFEHLGFEMEGELILADEQNPEKALWDDKLGFAKITPQENHYQFDLERFHEPLYVANENKQGFSLQNNALSLPVDDGFVLKVNGDTLLHLEISENLTKKGRAHYVLHSTNGRLDTCNFNHLLYQGYPLLDILKKSSRLFDAEVEKWLAGCYLLRPQWTYKKPDAADLSALHFFPSKQLVDSTNFELINYPGEKANNDQVHRIFRVNLAANTLFYTGFGTQKSPRWYMQSEQKKHQLKYDFPVRYHLQEDMDKDSVKVDSLRGLFICSLEKEVTHNEFNGGYYYPLLDLPQNVHHINASMLYHTGSASDKLNFKIIDHFKKGRDKSFTRSANEVFSLHSQNPDNTLKWIFQFNNLRDSNPLKMTYLYGFVLLFIGLVILTLFIVGAKNLSLIEMLAYMVLFCFLVIRIMLLWRMSTFVPVENIQPGEFNTLRKLKHFISTVGFVGIFFVIRWIFSANPRIQNMRYRLEDWWIDWKRNRSLERSISDPAISQLAMELSNQVQRYPLYFLAKWNGLHRFWQSLTGRKWEGLAEVQKLESNLKARGGASSIGRAKREGGINALRYFFRTAAFDSVSNFILAFFIYATVASLSLFVLGKTSGAFSTERFINIALPVVLYLYFDYRFQDRFGFDENRIFRVINALLALTWLAARDAGFSIIFLLFIILSNALIYFVRAYHEPHNQWRNRIISLLSFLAICFILAFTAPIFTTAFQVLTANPLFTTIGIGIALAIGSVLFLYTLREALNEKIWLRLRFGLPMLLALATLYMAVSCPNKISDKIQSFSYVKYRAEIHNKKLDDIISAIQFDSEESGQAMRAAQNQWFINTYIDDKKTKTNHNSYFNLQPHFNKGSSFITQTTDLVVTRYLIAEHSEFVVIALLTLLFLMVIAYSMIYDLTERNTASIFKLTTFLFTISYFIWLTATNRFIFFGQDFPLISLTSIFTVIFSLGLFLALILLSAQQDEVKVGLRGSEYKKFIRPFLPIILVGAIGLIIQCQNNITNSENFDINNAIGEVKNDFNELNILLKDIQQQSLENLNSDDPMEEAIYLDSLLVRLHLQINDKDGDVYFTKDKSFAQSIYNHFTEIPNKRDPDEILHLIKNTEGVYQFSVNRNYYLVAPPDHYRKRWDGNLLATATTKGYVFSQIGAITDKAIENQLQSYYKLTDDQASNLHLSIVPSDWLPIEKKKHPLILVSLEGKDISQTNKLSITNKMRGIDYCEIKAANATIALRDRDVISLLSDTKRLKSEKEFYLRASTPNYLMKNIWLNGDKRMFYPLSEKFLWAYHYARTIDQQYKATDTTRTKNVPISIDYQLTDQVYDLVKTKMGKQSSKQFAVTAIDGQGRIRLMLDYKPGLEVNPNDIEQMNEYSKGFYLNKNPKVERELYGNINLMHMKIGPGSSFKPIAYAAITSQYPFPWEHLEQVELSLSNAQFMNPFDSLRMVYYGGRPIIGERRERHLLRTVDRGNKPSKKIKNYGWLLGSTAKKARRQLSYINNKNYLIQSKNMYHSMIIFLGAYNQLAIEKLDQKIRSNKPLKEDILLRSPDAKNAPQLTFRFGGKARSAYGFNPDYFPSTIPKDDNPDVFFGNQSSLLGDGLRYFDLTTSSPAGSTQNRFQSIDPVQSNIFNPKSRQYYSYPEQSRFYQLNRDGNREEGYWTGIVQTALGGYPIEVTPLKMAEMMGKLFSLNSEYTASLDTAGGIWNQQRDGFNDPDWDEAKYFDFMQANLYQPLSEVMKSGTATNLEALNKISDKHWKRKDGFFYYAKTGTINRAKGNRKDDKLFSIIITNKDLSKISRAEMEDLKFYSIYFTGYFFDKPDWLLISSILKEIESSTLFTKYMQP